MRGLEARVIVSGALATATEAEQFLAGYRRRHCATIAECSAWDDRSKEWDAALRDRADRGGAAGGVNASAIDVTCLIVVLV